MPDPTLFVCNGASSINGAWDRVITLDWRKPGDILNLRPEAIEQFLGGDMPQRMRDLVEIAGYVYAADGMVSRGGMVGQAVGHDWRRRMHFVIAVRDAPFWVQPEIRELLADMLAFVSEDACVFHFVPGQFDNDPTTRSLFSITEMFKPADVVLFSGGLDSLSGALGLLDHGRQVLLVSHRSNDVTGSTQDKLVRRLREIFGPSRIEHLRVGFNLKTGAAVEDSHRARSFLFAALAAAAATGVGLDAVHFFENGIVSLNLPIAGAVVGTRATRSTHPKTLDYFRRVVSAASGAPIRYENPLFWKTKSEVVEDIMASGQAALISQARSCAKVKFATVRHPHCGVCTQCLDRRFAVLANGLEDHDPAVDYAIDLITGERERAEDRSVGVSFVRTALGYVGMQPDTFSREHTESLRALSYLEHPPLEARRRICDAHIRHGRAVKRVMREAQRRHEEGLLLQLLPETSLIRLLMGAGPVDLEAVPPPAPPAPYSLQIFNVGVEGATEVDAVFHVEGIGTLRKKGGLLMNVLAKHHLECVQAGKRPEDFPLVPTGQLEAKLGLSGNESLRKIISDLRGKLRKLAQARGIELGVDTILENQRGGYRLNPDRVRVIDVGKMKR